MEDKGLGDMKVDPAEIKLALKLLAATPRELESISKGQRS
jgi:hypothetical protein